MKAAYDAGINFFDCAEAYSKGESEKVMGDCIKHYGYAAPFRSSFGVSFAEP